MQCYNNPKLLIFKGAYCSCKGDNLCMKLRYKYFQGDFKVTQIASYEIPLCDSRTRANFYTNLVRFNERIEVHSHNYVEIAFVEDGSGVQQIGDEARPCVKGDLFLINSEIKHGFQPDEGTFLTIRNCIFLPDFFDCSLIGNKSFQTLSNGFLFRPFLIDNRNQFVEIHVIDDKFDKIRSLYEEIHSEYEAAQSGYLELIRAYMIELLIFILRNLESVSIEKGYSDETSKINLMITKKVLSYIYEHFSDDVTIDELSMLAFLSHAQFCRVFKKSTSYTVKEFMQKIRIEVACKLLNNRELTIANIANSVGYQDIKYFSKVFRKIIGKTPSSFREEIRKV